jgi:GNAT superfamily N-acetyltransferase
VGSDRHPDNTVVELPAEAATEQIGDDAIGVARYDADRRVVALECAPGRAVKAPPLWCVEVQEPAARPPATNLVAFTGHGVATGSLMADVDVDSTRVRSDDQLGAVRWYPATGEVDQIYVAPQWRQRSIGTGLVILGSLLSVARDWPRFWSDGQRTVLGENFRNGIAWGHRAADLTHVAPPMTPDEPG